MTAHAHPPLDVPMGLEREDESRARLDRLRQATAAFVGLGVLLRVLTYALNFPLWCDEAFVAANFISRGYRDLLRPLDYAQVCPLFFLWGELTAVKLFGYSEWSLRLIPTVSSLASLFLFAHVAGRLLKGEARLLAVGIFAVAYYPIRHGAEVKPYATDLFAALVLLALAVEWWRTPDRTRWLWALAVAAPLALGLSHPAVFMAGGVGLGLLGPVWKARRQGAVLPFAAYHLTMVGAFVALFAVVTSGQADSVGGTLRTHYWAGAFPPLRHPLQLAGWLLEAHTGHMFAHPLGGASGASVFTTYCFAGGLITLCRRREFALLTLALGPFGLALLAAALGRYPYGGSARTMLFVAPTICLLSGLGLAAVIARRLHPASTRRRALRAGVFGLALAGLVLIGLDLAHPYKSVQDERSRAFARRFWTEHARDAQLVCAKEDWGTVFNDRNWRYFRSSLYLCNQKIYRRRGPPDLEPISESRPLRCVLYNEPGVDDPAVAAWLAGLTTRFRLRGSATYVVNEPTIQDGAAIEDRYTVFEFVPRSDPPVVAGPPQPLQTRRR